MALTILQAKDIFILSKGNDKRMKKGFGPEYSEYIKLNIPRETEKEWLDEMVSNGVVVPTGESQVCDDFSIYEARALFDLTNGKEFNMARSYLTFYKHYEELVSEELHQEWCQELTNSYYDEISGKDHIDIQEYRHFLELADYPRLQENYDRAISLCKKLSLTAEEEKLQLVRAIMGVRSNKAKDGLAFWAYNYNKMEDVGNLMGIAYKLLKDNKEDTEQMHDSKKYYAEKWEEMMDIFKLDKSPYR